MQMIVYSFHSHEILALTANGVTVMSVTGFGGAAYRILNTQCIFINFTLLITMDVTTCLKFLQLAFQLEGAAMDMFIVI